MKKVTLKLMSMLCFVVMAQMSFAQISCLPQGIQLTASADNCDYEVTAGDVLTPASYANFPGATIEVFTDAAMTDLVDLNPFVGKASGGLDVALYVSATAPGAGSCWTTVILEDKTPPVVDCPCANSAIVTYTGTLDANSPTYNRAIGDDVSCFQSGVGTAVSYAAYTINIGATGEYTWEVTSFTGNDSYLSLYAGSFDPNNPCDNLIASNDDGGEGFLSMIMEQGSLGQTYILVMSTFANGTFGDFVIEQSIETEEQCEYLCTELPTLLDFAGGPEATAIDACGPVTTERSEELIDNECGNDILRRTYTFTDGSGNSATCTYDIIILPITDVDQFDPIPQYTGLPGDEPAFACDGIFLRLPNGAPSPEVTGYPTIDGVEVRTGGPCDAASTFEDQVVEICEGTTKYIRTWTVIGWCPEFAGPFTGIQVIKVKDDEGPFIDGLVNESISTTSTECTGTAIIQTPTSLSDNCSSGTITDISVSAGTLGSIGGVTAVFGLPIGTSTVTITAEDACGNESSESYDITVSDHVNPIAICETYHTVSLGWDPPTLVDAIVFDDGSYDNCEDISYQVRRMPNACSPNVFTSFGDKVGFYCCDIGTPVTVVLEVTDGNNNKNQCMVQVEVQDKIAPIITCPPNKPLDCHQDPFDTDLTGVATAIDNCEAFVGTSTSGSLDNCGEGTILRAWFASDKGNPDGTPDLSGNVSSCPTQIITVTNSDPFCIVDTKPWDALNLQNYTCEQADTPESGFDGHTNKDDVEWPRDIELSTCGAGLLPEDLEGVVNPKDVRPEIFEDFCDLVGVTYEDVVLPIQPDACVKVLRTWKVYNWCRFDEDNFNPNNPATGNDVGYWEYVQIIKVLTTADPTIDSSCDDVSFCSYDEDCAEGYAELILEASDDCTPADDLNYKYRIDAFNDGSYGPFVYSNDASGDYPLGTHKIQWKVEDGCGNITSCEYLFVISDCKKPTPYAHAFLTVELMPNNSSVELWAMDFNAGSFDNCGIQELLVYKGVIDPIQAAAVNPPAGASANIIFDCDDEPGLVIISFIAVDVNGLWDFVTVPVDVQDNMGACGNNASASIAGTIENEEANTVEGVNVAIDGEMLEGFSDYLVTTGATGSYEFSTLINGANYTIEADNDVDPLNGVTTFDLVLMSKHILGIQSLNSPYKLIAADVNKSGSITTFDMVQLRKLILFIDTEFQSNTSWRFVDADFVFPNAANPFQTAFPEVLNFNNVAGAESGDFVAIKVGDVNCSAQVNNFTGSSDDRSANGEVVFGVKDQALVAGQTYTVDFTAADFAEVLGYQFTLAFDKDAVEFVDVETSLEGLSAENFGTSLINEGVITTSWNSIEAVSLDADAKVFSLTFVAKSNAQLSDVLAVNSRYTKAEAYDNNVNLMNIGLSFNGAAAVAGEFELYQNQPNPFKSETVIGFNLPEAGQATLTIFDVTGKVLKLYQNEFAQGYNEVQINRAELAGSGVLYYQLDTQNFSATKKMILVK